jgi:hypothetical protein
VSKDKSVCFRKRPSFINETIHFEELGEEYLFNAKKRKRDEFEKKNKSRQYDEESEESTASNAGGKVSTYRMAAVEQQRKMFK